MRKNFFIVDNCIFDFKLPPIAFYIYCYLLKCRNKKTGCYPSKSTIAKGCGVAVSSVSKYIQLLSDRGLIQIRQNFRYGRQCNNSYELIELGVACPVLQTDGSKQDEPEGKY